MLPIDTSTAPNPGLQDGVKSAAQYQPEQTPGACPEHSRRIRPGIVEGLIFSHAAYWNDGTMGYNRKTFDKSESLRPYRRGIQKN